MDFLLRELLTLVRAQPYHSTPNSWCILGTFRYFRKTLKLKPGLQDLFHTFNLCFVKKRDSLLFVNAALNQSWTVFLVNKTLE